MIIYQTQIIAIGDNAEEFALDNTFVTFSENVPEELEDYCYIVENSELIDSIKAGDILQIDNSTYKILYVGSTVNHNIKKDSHASYKFNGIVEEVLPSSINLEYKPMPKIQLGSLIRIIRSSSMPEYKDSSTTNQLDKSLMLSDTYEEFLVENIDRMKTNNIKMALQKIVYNSDITFDEISKKSRVNKSYIYQIINGRRRPSRDKIIQLCFGLGLNLDNSNELLKAANYPELYSKSIRDSIFIYGIINSYSIDDVNKKLKKRNESTLY